MRAGAPGAPLKKQHGTWDSRWHSREAQTRVQRVARSQAPTSEREPQLWVVRGATEERASANLHRAPCPLAFESPSPCVAQRRGSSSTQNQSPRTSSSSDQVLNVECVSPHDHQAISPSSRPTRPLHLACSWAVPRISTDSHSHHSLATTPLTATRNRARSLLTRPPDHRRSTPALRLHSPWPTLSAPRCPCRPSTRPGPSPRASQSQRRASSPPSPRSCVPFEHATSPSRVASR